MSLLNSNNYILSELQNESEQFSVSSQYREHNSVIKNLEPLLDTKAKDLDPIELYIQITGKTGGARNNERKIYNLEKFVYYLNLDRKQDKEVLSISSQLKMLPNIK